MRCLHYLNVPNGSGTAFYRQRSTGIERVTEANAATFVETAQQKRRSCRRIRATSTAQTGSSNKSARRTKAD